MIRTRTYAFQGVRNVSFSENFVYVLNGWSLLRPEALINPGFLMFSGGTEIDQSRKKD